MSFLHSLVSKSSKKPLQQAVRKTKMSSGLGGWASLEARVENEVKPVQGPLGSSWRLCLPQQGLIQLWGDNSWCSSCCGAERNVSARPEEIWCFEHQLFPRRSHWSGESELRSNSGWDKTWKLATEQANEFSSLPLIFSSSQLLAKQGEKCRKGVERWQNYHRIILGWKCPLRLSPATKPVTGISESRI